MPKAAVFLGGGHGRGRIGWFALLSSALDELEAEREREPALKAQFETKLAQAVNLSELRKQKLQVQEYVTQLEKQLPGKAEMDALLSDINQAGLGRGLLFDLFKPGQVEVKDYYAELPITVAERALPRHRRRSRPTWPTSRASSRCTT
jgi:type IV pilus assembly protein PilO